MLVWSRGRTGGWVGRLVRNVWIDYKGPYMGDLTFLFLDEISLKIFTYIIYIRRIATCGTHLSHPLCTHMHTLTP